MIDGIAVSAGMRSMASSRCTWALMPERQNALLAAKWHSNNKQTSSLGTFTLLLLSISAFAVLLGK